MPGENDRLPWLSGSLTQAVRQEEGATKPILVYVYDGGMAKDCCAANFERAVFMYKPIVDLAKKFKCTKVAGMEDPMIKTFKLNKKKPAILLLDAEGGLIHKTQDCQDPRRYLRVVKQAYSLNGKRMKLKESFMAMRHEARKAIDKKDFNAALKKLEKMMKKEELLTGHVRSLIATDRATIVETGEEMLLKAKTLRDNKKLLDAYDLYKQVSKDFSRLKQLSKDAGSCAKEVKRELRDLGVTVR